MVHIFNIVLFPFTSRTFLVLFPCACTFVCSIFGLLYRLMRGEFCVSHS